MPQPSRPIKRQLSFSEDEFTALAGRARLAKRPFARYVRETALEQWLVVPPNRFDRAVLFDLNRVGGHLGRLAGAADAVGDAATQAELAAALADLRGVMAALFAAIRASRGASPEEDDVGRVGAAHDAVGAAAGAR